MQEAAFRINRNQLTGLRATSVWVEWVADGPGIRLLVGQRGPSAAWRRARNGALS